MAAPPISERHKMQFHRQAPVKELVRAATTANITLSGTQIIDGVSVIAEDRVLVKNQSTGSQNGIYRCQSGAWVRDYDLSTDDPGFGYLVIVIQGTANAGTIWRNTNTSAPTIGTTSLTFSQFSGGGSTTFGTPAVVLGTAAAAGSIDEAIRRDSTIVAFDATAPTTQAIGDSAAAGSAAVATRRDHKHGMPTFGGSGSASSVAHSDHSHGGGSGSSALFPIDSLALAATYGDEFDAASLDARWTRHNLTSGNETYQTGGGSWMRIAFGSTVDQSYFQTAPAGDFEIIFSFSLFSAATHMYGPMIISTTGAGIGASPYDNGQSVFQANLSGYQYSSSGNNVPLHSVGYMDMQKIWIGLKKVGTAYSCRYSQNGSTWSPYTATTTNAFTVDRIGFGRFLGSGSTHIMEVDRFNVI